MDSEGPDQPDHPSDQGLHCPQTESLDTIEYTNGELRPRWYFAHVQGDSESAHVSRNLMWPIKKHMITFLNDQHASLPHGCKRLAIYEFCVVQILRWKTTTFLFAQNL